MSDWVCLGPVSDLAEGRGNLREATGLKMAVFLEGEDVSVLLDRCPHAGGSLGQGWIEEGEVVCPLHRWRFRLGDGRCTTMRGESVHRFRAEIRDASVWVRV